MTDVQEDIGAIAALQLRNRALETEIAELRAILETMQAHGDIVEDVLHQEKEALELLIETTTAHSDILEDELQDRADEALRESEKRLREIVEITPVALFISRADDGTVVYANNLGGPLLGVPQSDVVGLQITDFISQDAERTQVLAQIEKSGLVDNMQIRLRQRGGAERWIDLSVRELTFKGERCYLSSWNDVTDLVELNKTFARFVPVEWLGFLDKSSVSDMQLGDHISKKMTVMFSDMRSFTSMSEQMTPKESFDFINEYYHLISPPVKRNDGLIVKYLADGVLAVFPDSADHAVAAGLQQLRAIKRYNSARVQAQLEPVSIGIGVNTGPMMVGLVGDVDRIQGDAISDAVNLTARIEQLTSFYGASFLVTDETRQGLSAHHTHHVRFVDKVRVKGKSDPLELFEIFDEDDPAQIDLKEATRADFEAAMDAYYLGDFQNTQARLFSVLQRNPRDKVAWRHLVQATRWMDEGTTGDWATTVMLEK